MTTLPGPLVASSRPAGMRLAVCLLVGVVAGAAVVASGHVALGAVVGWLVAAGLFTAVSLGLLLPLDAEQTAAHALREDPSRQVSALVVVLAALVSLLGVGLVLDASSSAHGAMKALDISVSLATVVASWAVVHLMFMVRYAGEYFSGGDGGIGFSGDERPTYLDFAYLSYTIGMCFQVSDTELQSRTIRATALRHALLSYVFGTGIVAVTINVVAGLVS